MKDPFFRSSLRWIGYTLLAVVILAVGWRAATDSIDFPQYHRVGSQILHGDFELYPFEGYSAQARAAWHGFRYAPAIAFLFVPFALLPLPAAAGLFYALKIAALAHALTLVARWVGSAGGTGRIVLAVVLVAGGFLVEELRGGNLHLLVIYAIVLAWVLVDRGRVVLPGVLLALAIAVKITPVLFLGYLAVRRQGRLVAVTAAALGLLALAPAAVWGPSHNARLLRGFWSYSTEALDVEDAGRNYAIRGALLSWRPFGLGDRAMEVVWLSAALLAAALVAWFAWRDRSRLARHLDLALLFTLWPLVSPHAQRIYFTALLVPAAILPGLLARRAVPHAGSLAAALAITALAGTVAPLLLPSRRLALAYLDLSPYTFAAALLAVAITVARWRVTGVGAGSASG